MNEKDFLEALQQLRKEVEDNRIERRLGMASLEQKMQELDLKVDQLMRIANIGEGVMWTLLRVGAVVAALGVVCAWIWDHITWK